MNLIELHMLQSFPVNCLNRDQFGSPKSTVFGGVPRARHPVYSDFLKGPWSFASAPTMPGTADTL